MLRIVLAVLVAGALTALMMIDLSTYGPWSGDILFTVSATHGIHRGDLPSIGFWLIGLVGVVALGWPRD